MRLEGISFRYGKGSPWVLRDVVLELAPGEIVEVSGRNGAGKSTLLRIAAGILRPVPGPGRESGRRRGRVVGRPERVGYAPERFPAAQPFTVAAYLRHLTRIRGIERSGRGAGGAVRPQVHGNGHDLADRLGLTALMGVPLPELSKGSAQKVGILQALLDDPMLLVLDEPFAGLDAQARDALPALLSERAAQGAIILVSDHQHCLKGMDGLSRIRMESGRPVTYDPGTPTDPAGRTDSAAATACPMDTVTPCPMDSAAVSAADRAAAATPAGHGPPPREVLEVEVPADRADEVTARLRADGFDVRRRSHR